MDAAPPFIKHQITLQLIRRPRQLLEHPGLIFGVCWGSVCSWRPTCLSVLETARLL